LKDTDRRWISLHSTVYVTAWCNRYTTYFRICKKKLL